MKKLIAALALSFALLPVGCVHNAQSNAGKATPYQQVVTYDAALATTNNSVAQAVVTLNVAGSLNDDQTKTVLNVQKKVAESNIELSKILAKGPSYAQANVESIQALVANITESVQHLQADGVIPVNANTQQLQAEVQSLLSLTDLIVVELKQAGVK